MVEWEAIDKLTVELLGFDRLRKLEIEGKVSESFGSYQGCITVTWWWPKRIEDRVEIWESI